jgi:hypothetical protein
MKFFKKLQQIGHSTLDVLANIILGPETPEMALRKATVVAERQQRERPSSFGL